MSICKLKVVSYNKNDCEPFSFEENIVSVKEKLNKAGFNTYNSEMNGLTIMENDQNSVELIFDKENKLCGVVNNKVDGSDQEDIGVAFISETGTVDYFTIGEFCNNFTDETINLEKYYVDVNDPDMVPLDGCVHYWYNFDIAGNDYLVQCTETYSTFETISIMRKDLMDLSGIVFKATIGNKEYNSVNTIDLIKAKENGETL